MGSDGPKWGSNGPPEGVTDGGNADVMAHIELVKKYYFDVFSPYTSIKEESNYYGSCFNVKLPRIFTRILIYPAIGEFLGQCGCCHNKESKYFMLNGTFINSGCISSKLGITPQKNSHLITELRCSYDDNKIIRRRLASIVSYVNSVEVSIPEYIDIITRIAPYADLSDSDFELLMEKNSIRREIQRLRFKLGELQKNPTRHGAKPKDIYGSSSDDDDFPKSERRESDDDDDELDA